MPQVIAANLYGIIPGTGIGLVLIGSSIGGDVIFEAFGRSLTAFVVCSLLLLFTLVACVALSIYLIPTFGANPYIRMLVKGNLGQKQPDSIAYVCQCSLSPRLHDGLRGFLEDADDVGWLEITGEGVTFSGDHVNLSLPFHAIDRLIPKNRGYRTLWICGDRILLYTQAIEGVESIEFREREANTVPSSRRLTEEMIRAIKANSARVRVAT